MTAAELSDMYDNKDQKVEFMVQTDSGHSLIIGPYVQTPIWACV